MAPAYRFDRPGMFTLLAPPIQRWRARLLWPTSSGATRWNNPTLYRTCFDPNGDGVTDIADLMMVAGAFGS